MKRMICVILSVCLLAALLAGCGGGEDGGGAAAPMGRYVEEQGEILENLSRTYGFHRAADGAIVFYGLSLEAGAPAYYRYVKPADGGALEKTAQDWLAGLIGEGSLRDVSEASDGSVYLLYSTGPENRVAVKAPSGDVRSIPVADLEVGNEEIVTTPGGDKAGAQPSGGEATEGVITVHPDGSVSANEPGSQEETDGGADAGPDGGAESPGGISVSSGSSGGSFTVGGDGGVKYVSGLAALDDGFLLYFGDAGVYRYGGDGVKRAEYPGAAFPGSTAVSGNTLLVLSPGGGELWSYDLDAAKQSGSYTYDNLSYGTHVGMDGGGVYLADSTGIYRQATGGTIWERLVDGGLTSMIMPNVGVSGLVSDGGDGFHALLSIKEDACQLVHYEFDPNTPTDPDTELTIFALQDNATIRQAIGEFQRANPNVRVNFRVALEAGGAATAEDVIRSLNTEILSGKGPDLLLLDGLPVDSYIEKGVLLDLTELVDRQVAEQGLLPNLMNAYSRDGGIYGVPSKFTVPVMMGPSGEVDALRTLAGLAERAVLGAAETPPFLRAPGGLWSEEGAGMLMEYYDALSGTFLKDGAIDQQALKEYFDAMLRIDRAVKEYTPQTGASIAMVTVTVSIRGGGGFEEMDMGASDLKNGAARLHITELSGLYSLRNVSDNLSPLGGQKLDSLFGAKRYTPVGGVGVLASGGQRELAMSFVELLLSPTVQDSYVYDGYPVNGGSLDTLLSEILEGADDLGFAALCRTLDAPILVDEVVKAEALAQARALLDGSVTPEQAAANVAEKTQLYLAE